MTTAPETRSGFSLLELLVATGIFVLGFTSIYALFLQGARDRHAAEHATRCSLAASSLLAELRLHAGREIDAPWTPAKYLGDGLGGNDPDALHAYLDQPGIWYTIRESQDLHGENGNEAIDTLFLRLYVTYLPLRDSSTPLPIDELARRLRIDTDETDDHETALRRAAERGSLQVYEAIIQRHPSWP